MSYMKRIAPFLTVAFFLSGCASTQMQKVERAPGFQSAQIRKVLVISAAKMPERRRAIEEEFSSQWKKRKVNAVASYTLIQDLSSQNKESVATLAREQRFDSVLLGQLKKRGEITPQYPNQAQKDSAGMTEDIQVTIASPQDPIDFEAAIITTKLYDVATEQLQWTGVSQTIIISGNVQDVFKPLVKTILKSLYEKP